MTFIKTLSTLALVAVAGVSMADGPKVATMTVPTIKPINMNFQAPSTSSWSGSAYYDVTAKRAAAVVFNRIGELTLKGKDSGIEVDGFAGVSDQKGAPATLGFAVLWHKNLFDQVSLVFGIGGSETNGKLGGGPIVGAAIRF